MILQNLEQYMKKKVCFVLSIFMTLAVNAQVESTGDTTLVKESPKKFYFAGKDGAKCSPDYEWVGTRNEGYYVVKQKGKLGVIDSLLNTVIPCSYDEGGKIVSEGLWNTMKDDFWGYLDMNGDEAIPFDYEFNRPFYKGYAYVGELVGGKVCFGLIDHTNTLIVPVKWANILYTDDVSTDINSVWVAKDSLYSRLDLKTNEISYPSMFGTVVFDGKGNSIVRSGKYWGAVDPDGKMVIPLKLTRRQMVADILKMMQDKGIQQIGEKDAYSLNIRMSQERYLLMLSDVVPDYLWDY